MRPVISLCALAVFCACAQSAPPPPPEPERIHLTYRIISGVSMGGIGAAALGFSHPEKFDGIGALGGPIDAAFFTRALSRFNRGGWCPLSTLEQLLATDPNSLNDPAVIDACAQRPATIEWEHSTDFNHWVWTKNGTNFTRDTALDMSTDLSLAFGNPFTENPASNFAPVGIDPERLRHPPADFCTNPVVVKNVYDRDYNPTGKYDAITFCDGQPTVFYCRDSKRKVDFCSDRANIANPLPVAQEQTFAAASCASEGGAVVANRDDDALFLFQHGSQVDPCRQPRRPFLLALALDMNKNGRRDYGEPVIGNATEHYDDVGADGCADALEDGHGGCLTSATATGVDPNGDNYQVEKNPLGTENDWRHEDGEPYEDFGLDGVAGTGDFGEADGKFDTTQGYRRMEEYDGRVQYRALSDTQRKRLEIFLDGGIRDMANLGLMARHLFALVRALRGESSTGYYRDFLEIPGMKDSRSGYYNPWNNRWKYVPRNIAVLYGKDNPTDQDRIDGEGDHVGTPGEAVNRFYTLFNWAAASWPSLERPVTPLGGSSAQERQKFEWYLSAALGNAKREYAIALPPGYDDPANADKRYPVMFVMHGYGMEPLGFMGTSIISDTFVTDTDVKLRPMIMVFPSGRCCFENKTTGQRDCREQDDSGKDYDRIAGWERECHSGSFYVNRQGYGLTDKARYGDAFFELMEHVDKNYRTLAPADVTAR
jgi:hypothetical protein